MLPPRKIQDELGERVLALKREYGELSEKPSKLKVELSDIVQKLHK